MQKATAARRPARPKVAAPPKRPSDPNAHPPLQRCQPGQVRHNLGAPSSPPSRRESCHAVATPPFAKNDVERYGFAQSVRCGDTVWVSGTVASGPDGRLVRGGIRRQTRQVFDNLNQSLRAAGCRGLEDVVDITAAIVDAERNAAGFVDVRAKCMPRGTFTSMATGVSALLVPGALVEVKCTAVVGRSRESRP
nr:aldr family transcriptional regulator [Pandoravirus massiliensis]